MTDEIAALILELKARAHERAGGNSMVEVGQLLEWKAAEALSRFTTLPMPEGHGEPCYYCGKLCDNLAGNPGLWPIALSHADDPGVTKWHHAGCVSSRLEAPPLPEDIAGLIERARGYPEGSFTELVAALRALAQENERLKGGVDAKLRDTENAEQRARIRGLEAALPQQRAYSEVDLTKLRVERNAIRAKTICEA